MAYIEARKGPGQYVWRTEHTASTRKQLRGAVQKHYGSRNVPDKIYSTFAWTCPGCMNEYRGPIPLLQHIKRCKFCQAK